MNVLIKGTIKREITIKRSQQFFFAENSQIRIFCKRQVALLSGVNLNVKDRKNSPKYLQLYNTENRTKTALSVHVTVNITLRNIKFYTTANQQKQQYPLILNIFSYSRIYSFYFFKIIYIIFTFDQTIGRHSKNGRLLAVYSQTF